MSVPQFTQEDYTLIEQEFEALMTLVSRRCKEDSEIPVIRKAFEFANSAHTGRRRRSGEPYIIHPISVAKIVVGEIGLGYKSITAALLHDVVDNTDYTVDDIRNLFGEKIGSLVEGLSKIKVVLDNGGNTRAENLKHMLLTLNDDARVVLIKLADRLHNCRTIEYMPEVKRDKILSETMFIFIPLAHRLGLYSIKSEMENIWLRFKEPEAYRELTRRIEESVSANKDAIDEFIAPISGALRRDDFDFEIKTRIKSPYSVWHKMKAKNIPFEQIYDLYAVRIIFTPSSDDPEVERKQAYMIYADVIGLYKENPGRHRDWIESPKSNGYEALHSTLMSQAGIWIEVQIRSERMDDIAEKGIAAHWAYKKDGYAAEGESSVDRYDGAMDVDYREFTKLFEYIGSLKARYDHEFNLVLITLNTPQDRTVFIDEIEKAMQCMEQSIRQTIRKVDIVTRYSSVQFLTILMEADESGVKTVIDRIFQGYYKLYGGNYFEPTYAVADLSDSYQNRWKKCE